MAGLFACIAIFLIRAAMAGSMVSFWWASVAPETAVALLGLLVFSWVVGVFSKRGKSDKSMLGEIILVGCV